MSRRALTLAVAVLAVATAIAPVRVLAQERASFGVTVAGVGAGALTLVGSESGGRYEVQGAARSTGLVGAVARLGVDAAASGRVTGNAYRPAGYTEVVQDRDGTSRKRMSYAGGVPQVTEEPPDDDRKAYHADPAGQGGTVDPLTLVWALLRDRPRDLACALDLRSYDGQRTARVRLGGARAEGDTLVCPGIYTREAGYSPKEMAERRRWDFTLVYRATASGGYEVAEMRLPLTVGLMRFTRR